MSHHIRSPLSSPISQIDMNDIRLHKIKRGSGLQNLDSNMCPNNVVPPKSAYVVKIYALKYLVI